MIGYEERSAIVAVDNIDTALLHMEIWPERGKLAIPYIDDIILRLGEGGIDERDKFRYDFFVSWKKFLLNPPDRYPKLEDPFEEKE